MPLFKGKEFFIATLLVLPTVVFAQVFPYPGTWRTHHSYVNFIYDFDLSGGVDYHYRSEFREHDVKGRTRISNDTIFISYFPFITSENQGAVPGDTLHIQVFRQDSGTYIPHADFQVFYHDGKRSSFYAGEKGTSSVANFSNIDSIFFVREFCNSSGKSLFALRKQQLASNNLRVYINIGAWQISKFGQGHPTSLPPEI